ncbi:uncharacterized protein ARMOST_15238 [Armillaria ostoyae]|uniref:Uncharacterized protein n=1 Tax=Armillaria ostoyae TaxID=47428 RepID=A0A284RSV0_ARMOS|nr:uncharacterized protein ARMOST_15238 [Armillaria ostoyae]
MGRLTVPVYGGGLHQCLRPSSRPPAASSECSDTTPSDLPIDPRLRRNDDSNVIAMDVCTSPRPPAASSKSSDAAPRNPTVSPRSRADESPEFFIMGARTGLSRSSPDSTDVNSIPSNGEEISCSCLGVVGVSLAKFGWVRRVVFGLGGHSRKVRKQ